MKNVAFLSLAAVAALASEPVTIQKITIEADSVASSDAKNVYADEMVKFSRQSDLGEMLSATLPEISHVRASAVGNDIIIRGFKKDNINVTIDDAKVCGACPNRMDPPAMHVSSSQIQRVEVKEGPFDVTQAGSLGGAVNVITKDPKKGLGGEISTTLGSYDYRKISGVVEGGNDAIQALVGYSRETSGQYKDGDGKTMAEQTEAITANSMMYYTPAHKNDNAYERENFWSKIVGHIGDNQKLTLSYFGDRADNVLYPRYMMDALYDDTDMFKATYQLYNIASFSKELKIEAYHSKVDHLMGNDYRNKAIINNMMNHTHEHSTASAVVNGLRIENKAEMAGSQITFGFDGTRRNWDAYKDSLNNITGALESTQSQIPDVQTDDLGLYAKVAKQIGNYEISAGLRYDDASIDPDTTRMATARSRNFNNVSANLLAKYNYTSTSNVFLGIGQSVRIPDAKELYFVLGSDPITNDLKEVVNREIDLGTEHTFGDFHIKGTLFYSDLKDYIYAYKKTAAIVSYANIDAKIYGGDISADYLLNNEWSVQSGIAYQKGKKKDAGQLDALSSVTQADTDLADIPPLKGRLALVYDDMVNYAMAEILAANGQTYDQDNGEIAIRGYGILNLKYGHDFQNGFSFNAGLNNFFNRTYAVSNSYVGLSTLTTTQPLVMNEPGRNFYATLSYKF